jgi:hypothetical protein
MATITDRVRRLERAANERNGVRYVVSDCPEGEVGTSPFMTEAEWEAMHCLPPDGEKPPRSAQN